jgi:hypothetical protein
MGRCIVALILLGFGAECAFASLSFVPTRGGLTGSDSFSIGTVGADGTTEPSSGFTFATVDGNPITFSDTGASGFTVVQESNEWSGNFANNDLLLWTSGDAVPTTISFGSAVLGVGLQIQPDAFGTPFTASITAFNGATILGSFFPTGSSTSANDNSALFIGVADTTADITSIVINITSPAGVDYAFNELTFSSATPEPSSFALLACGAILLTIVSIRRSRRIAG